MARLVVLFLALAFIFFSCERGDPTEKNSTAADTARPEDNRFIPVVLTAEAALDEPMMFQVSSDESVYIIERKGGLKKFDARTKATKLIATIPVYSGYEQGLIGLALDPQFDQNHWIYLQYAPADQSVFRLDRFELVEDKLNWDSRKTLLTIPVEREGTNHTGGGMAWDKDGNLYITVGNNTGNSLLAQTDERNGNKHLDDQRGASNTNDLRGKILRIHPEPDGTYTIPEGNLFPPGTANTRPEIYTMGHRNVWRASVDSKTGWIYWGEIGPDQDQDSPTGPRGYDEQNQAKGPGFFGWPYFIANNRPIPKYDFVNNKVGDTLDAQKPLNTSPNNTGLRELPPAQPALIYYPYAASEDFPLVGSSSRCAIGGPVYHRADFANAKRAYPGYYEGKWLMADYSRFWIMAVTLDKDGNYKSMERFAPHYHPVQPLDTKFGPNGDLYVLEYGPNTVRSAMESRLIRIEYHAGNRKPVAKASAAKKGGAVPFKTTLKSDGSIDYDKDKLQYNWVVKTERGKEIKLDGESPEITLDEPGVYMASLTVTDEHGEQGTATTRLIAGNEPPVVTLKYEGNATFFFPNGGAQYEVTVSDKEDGDLQSGRIKPGEIAVSNDYVSEGFDFPATTVSHAALDASTRFAVAQALINNSDCRSCHTKDIKAFGPAFAQIADRYKNAPNAVDTLAFRIRRGSSGIWGTENNMPAHPSISENDARVIGRYILNINTPMANALPPKGKMMSSIPTIDNGRGTFIIRAAYTDKGVGNVPAQTSDTVLMLRSPRLNPLKADSIGEGALRDQLDEYVFLTAKPNSFITFNDIDLTGVKQFAFVPNWHLYDIYPGGKIEVRLDGPDGELIGETTMEPEQFNTRYRGLFDGLKDVTSEKQLRMKRYPQLDPQKFFARGADKNTFTIPSFATIKPQNGKHNLCFVFKNDKVAKTESLFPLTIIEARNTVK